MSDINGGEWYDQLPETHGEENGAGTSAAVKQLSDPAGVATK